jgi:hypothetical protein
MSSALVAATLMIVVGQMHPEPSVSAENAPTVPDGSTIDGGYQNGNLPADAYFANSYGNYRVNAAMQPVSPGGGPVTDPYLNYDAYEPWVHGYWQELPAFGGYAYFRPYNHRHVYVQSEVAAGWGTSAQMPYSQEYYRRAREQGIYEQRTSATRPTRLPLVYRQSSRAPEVIARVSGERPKLKTPDARRPGR